MDHLIEIVFRWDVLVPYMAIAAGFGLVMSWRKGFQPMLSEPAKIPERMGQLIVCLIGGLAIGLTIVMLTAGLLAAVDWLFHAIAQWTIQPLIPH